LPAPLGPAMMMIFFKLANLLAILCFVVIRTIDKIWDA